MHLFCHSRFGYSESGMVRTFDCKSDNQLSNWIRGVLIKSSNYPILLTTAAFEAILALISLSHAIRDTLLDYGVAIIIIND